VTARRSRWASALVAAWACAAATPARAHHGSASASFIGVEGPGAALDTSTALPLGERTFVALAKTEYVPYQQREGFADQKQYSWFNTLALGFGLRPWLSAFVFQPYSVKAQDGVGTNRGLGDTNLMLSAALKWDDGLQLAPERESLDDLRDWHFGLWASCTLPVGPTDHLDANGEPFAPDMQSGFHGPSPAAGLTVLKQVSTDFTVLGEASYQYFFEQSYAGAGLRYQFGGEGRVNAALSWRAWASGSSRIDLVPEVSFLSLARDREGGVPLRASGGDVLYGQLGVRAALGPISLGVSVKRALATRLNEASEQQGSEGLEAYRAAIVVGWATRI
jgi:hypothetical protein